MAMGFVGSEFNGLKLETVIDKIDKPVTAYCNACRKKN